MSAAQPLQAIASRAATTRAKIANLLDAGKSEQEIADRLSLPIGRVRIVAHSLDAALISELTIAAPAARRTRRSKKAESED